MKYFKNTELAKLHHISEKTVRNWIEAAQQGKLSLILQTENDKQYVANISQNRLLIESLVAKGKKYKNSRGYKVITPTAKFYKLYSRKQILDIISNLEIHREIPRQYNYFDGGANYWDDFANQMMRAKTTNVIKSTVELLDANKNAIDLLLGNAKHINVVDIGVGNALPVKGLLTHLVERDLLNRYIAIDISNDILAIAKKNIKDWFGEKIKFEGYVRDITYERFDDVLVDDLLSGGDDQIVSLVLLLGGTIMNFRSPYGALKVVYGSMKHDDLLIYTDKPDTEVGRRDFDVNAQIQDESTALSLKYRFILNLLNIDQSLYDVEMGFNEQRLERYIRIRLRMALTLKFEFEDGVRNVDLNKGDAILMWRAWHQTSLEIITQFEQAGLELLQSSMTKDRQYLLTISGVGAEPPFSQKR